MGINGNLKNNFTSVAHLYLGCKCVLNLSDAEGVPPNYIGTLDKIDTGVCIGKIEPPELFLTIGDYEAGIDDDVKPILHRLEDMTGKDAKLIVDELPAYLSHEKDIDHHFIQALINGTRYVMNYIESVEITRILLSNHYDLFNLIDNGQAIDAKTLTK